ncbi:hypothetical protein KP509_20G085900 [Ceratopteris richardii]|uniref:Uncharacterized protein n=1 Tax=Ceratopteris richardii TaxID=49495 RepID=A0A8T2SKL3_CERRI|nr:hypothetical protein KP509_20G085900 [Ceratopteris richardii]
MTSAEIYQMVDLLIYEKLKQIVLERLCAPVRICGAVFFRFICLAVSADEIWIPAPFKFQPLNLV